MWWILGLMAAAGLIVFFRNGPNAVWGTATVAIVIGAVVAFFSGWPMWDTIWKSVIIGALIGTVFEVLPRLTGGKTRGQ
ncbi:hypothetical protein [Sphingobium chungangianum]